MKNVDSNKINWIRDIYELRLYYSLSASERVQFFRYIYYNYLESYETFENS